MPEVFAWLCQISFAAIKDNPAEAAFRRHASASKQ
jgi:hypothetical protein